MRRPTSGAAESRTALMVPSPASATTSTMSGASRPARSTASPSAAIGDRTPPAVSTIPTSIRSGQRSSEASSATVNDARPSTSAAIGGAIATSYQRWGGHTSCGRSPVASARISASVGPSPGVND